MSRIKREWSDDDMAWRRWDDEAQAWVAEDPPLPGWAKTSQGAVSAARFARAWASASTINEVKSQFFWRTVPQLDAQREQISRWLVEQGLQPLPPLPSRREIAISPADLEVLVNEGLLRRAGEAPAAPPAASAATAETADEEPAAEEPAAEEPAAAAEPEEEELDLTPTPARPREPDPWLISSPHLQPVVDGTSRRFRIKH